MQRGAEESSAEEGEGAEHRARGLLLPPPGSPRLNCRHHTLVNTLPRLTCTSPPISVTHTLMCVAADKHKHSVPRQMCFPVLCTEIGLFQMLNNYHDNHLHPTGVWKCIPDIWHLVPMTPRSICIITFLPNFHAFVWKGKKESRSRICFRSGADFQTTKTQGMHRWNQKWRSQPTLSAILIMNYSGQSFLNQIHFQFRNFACSLCFRQAG